MAEKFKYLFGPVPSRRLGRSLGLDLTPFKTCNLNCVFCQLGRTTNQTSQRKAYVPIESVKEEFLAWQKADGQADQITLAGSGEPTLHAEFGEIIRFVKENSEIPVTLLTNGASMYLPEVRAAAALADTVKVSLSAWDEASYQQINRPCADMSFKNLFEGEREFRKEFSGRLLLEVFLLDGMNADEESVGKIADLAVQIQPDHIQLNTCVRPVAEDFARLVPKERMQQLTRLFKPVAELIADFSVKGNAELEVDEEAILAMIRRRPCTAKQIAEVFGMHLNHVGKYLGKLTSAGNIEVTRRNDNVFYVFVKPIDEK